MLLSNHRHHPQLHPYPTRRSSDLALIVDDSDAPAPREQAAPEAPQPPEPVHTPRSAFSTAVDHSFLMGDGAEGDGLFGERSEEHTSELQSRPHLVCRLLLEKKNIS